MTRTLPVVLDETVTDTHCGGCGYRVVAWDPDPICSQDEIIIGISCALILGERWVSKSGSVHYRHRSLEGDSGSIVNMNLYNYDTGECDPVPDTRRLRECIEREQER